MISRIIYSMTYPRTEVTLPYMLLLTWSLLGIGVTLNVLSMVCPNVLKLFNYFFDSVGECKNHFHGHLLSMGMVTFSGAFPSNSFPWLFLSFQTHNFLLFSFQGVWPGQQPSAGESLECFLTHWALSRGLNLCHKPIQLLWGGSAAGTESGSEDRVGSMKIF